MSPILVTVLIGIAAFFVGGALCYIIFRYSSISMLRKAEEEAEIIKKNKIVEAKEKFIALKLEHDNQIRADEQRKQQREQQIQQREQQLNSKQGELQRQQNELLQKQQQVDNQVKALDYKAAEVEKMHKQAELQLEQLSGMSAEDAKKQLIEALKDEAKTDAMAYINETLDEARLTANKEAKDVKDVISALSKLLPVLKLSWTILLKLSLFPAMTPLDVRLLDSHCTNSFRMDVFTLHVSRKS